MTRHVYIKLGKNINKTKKSWARNSGVWEGTIWVFEILAEMDGTV